MKTKIHVGVGILAIFAMTGTLLGQDGASAKKLRPTTEAFAFYTEKALERTRERLAARGDKCELIFVGDSITDAWESKSAGSPSLAIWQKYYGHRTVLNFGHVGDTTSHVLWRLENMDVKKYSPKVVVMMIGDSITEKSKKTNGPEYDVCGKDGFHPEKTGRLVMAQEFLKALLMPVKHTIEIVPQS